MARVTQEAVDGDPTGPAAGAAARYAQALVSEDLIVNGVLSGGRPLALTTWRGRTGAGDLSGPGGFDRGAGHRRVRIDLRRTRGYAAAVRTATDGYLAGLADGAPHPEPECLLTALLVDLASRRGEIACLLDPAAASAP